MTDSFKTASEGTGHARGIKSGPGTAEIWMGQSMKQFPGAVVAVGTS